MIGEASSVPSASRAIWRGVTRKCPRCGVGRLFRGWYRLLCDCAHCGLRFPDSTPDQIGLIYLTTGVQTAVFAFIVLIYQPSHPWLSRVALILAALGLMLANLPNRKGLAIAVSYLIDRGT